MLQNGSLRKEVAKALVEYTKPTPSQKPPPKTPQFRVTIGPVKILTDVSQSEWPLGVSTEEFPHATTDIEYTYAEPACFPAETAEEE